LKRLNVRSLTVIVTGYPDSDLLAETMKLGPLTIILKPFDLSEIQRAVEALVQMT
jgi:FixJ family two-component response regulator